MSLHYGRALLALLVPTLNDRLKMGVSSITFPFCSVCTVIDNIRRRRRVPIPYSDSATF